MFSVYLNEFLIVVTTMVLALLSPGPDFAMILKQSITYGKRTSIYTSIGLGFGVMFHVAYSILGIGLIIAKSSTIFMIVKFLGAFYLIYLGYKSLLSKGFKIKSEGAKNVLSMGFKKSFLIGFLCNVLNPKAALFFISLFTVIVDVNTPLYMQLSYGAFAVFATMLWFSALSLILSQDRVRGFFNHVGKWFDRFMGLVLITLGIKIGL